MPDNKEPGNKHYVLPKSGVVPKVRRLEIADALRKEQQLDLGALADAYRETFDGEQDVVLVTRGKRDAPKVKQEPRPSRPLFEIDDERKLRRPQTTMGDTEASAGAAFRVIEIEPVQGKIGPTYLYVLVELREDGEPYETDDLKHLLKISQWRLKHHSRENACPTPSKCPTSASPPTKS